MSLIRHDNNTLPSYLSGPGFDLIPEQCQDPNYEYPRVPAEKSLFDCRQWQDICLFFRASLPAVDPTMSFVRLSSGQRLLFPREESDRHATLSSRLLLVPRSTMRGALRPRLHTSFSLVLKYAQGLLTPNKRRCGTWKYTSTVSCTVICIHYL